MFTAIVNCESHSYWHLCCILWHSGYEHRNAARPSDANFVSTSHYPCDLGKLLTSGTYLDFLICTMELKIGLSQRVIKRIKVINNCKAFRTVPEL